MSESLEIRVFQRIIIALELFARHSHGQLSQPARLNHFQWRVCRLAIVDPLNHLPDPSVALMIHLNPKVAEKFEIAMQLIHYGNAHSKIDDHVRIVCENVLKGLRNIRVPFYAFDACRLVYHPPGPGNQNSGIQGFDERDRGDGEVRGPVSEGLDERKIQLLD